MSPLRRLRTPSKAPWTNRVHVRADDGDFRDPFDRDRDRILHSRAFRRLQHKTQVLIVTESDDYRTRITHSLEVAQIARSIARGLGLTEPLAEAIALGHDVGHTPFGHEGEDTLGSLLHDLGGWNSNAHSLRVLDELETQYSEHSGLDLTLATREGVARHKTEFDDPIEGFSDWASPSLECQVVNLADPLAYVSHDLHDALDYGLVTPDQLEGTANPLWTQSWRIAEAQFDLSHIEGRWPGVDSTAVKYRVVHRQIINKLVRDVLAHSNRQGADFRTLRQVREHELPIVDFSPPIRRQVSDLIGFMFDTVYKSPLVVRQNAKARMVLERLFEALVNDVRLLPLYVQERVAEDGTNLKMHVGHFLASLTDRGAFDLYAELFEPAERAMGRHVR
jgi:dGTPase